MGLEISKVLGAVHLKQRGYPSTATPGPRNDDHREL